MMGKEGFKELRRERRHPVYFRTSLSIEESGNYGGTILDLSNRGCMLQSYMHVTSGTSIGLNLTIPGEEGAIEIERAEIRWSREPLYGIEFIAMQPQQHERLRQVVENIALSPRS
jgi:PilZ domain-containing protein